MPQSPSLSRLRPRFGRAALLPHSRRTHLAQQRREPQHAHVHAHQRARFRVARVVDAVSDIPARYVPDEERRGLHHGPRERLPEPAVAADVVVCGKSRQRLPVLRLAVLLTGLARRVGATERFRDQPLRRGERARLVRLRQGVARPRSRRTCLLERLLAAERADVQSRVQPERQGRGGRTAEERLLQFVEGRRVCGVSRRGTAVSQVDFQQVGRRFVDRPWKGEPCESLAREAGPKQRAACEG